MISNEPMHDPGADRALSRLFDVHYDEILAYCARRIGVDAAEDAATDVFAVAWTKVDNIDWDTVRPWLYGIARGVLANRARSRRRRGRLFGRLAGLGQAQPETPEAYVIRRDQDRRVVAAMGRLKQSDREILMLDAWEELTGPEIASVLDISTSAAGQRLHRAKKRLANVLTPPEGSPEFSPRATQEGRAS